MNDLERSDERELALRNVLQAPSSDREHASLREAQAKGLNRYKEICRCGRPMAAPTGVFGVSRMPCEQKRILNTEYRILNT